MTTKHEHGVGTCRICGCTDTTPCNLGTDDDWESCGWEPGERQTLCTHPDCLIAGLETDA